MSATACDAVPLRGAEPASLVGLPVAVRPFYHQPTGHGSATSRRAERCYRGLVIEIFGTEMVVVEFPEHAPGNYRQAFFPRELHHTRADGCPGCTYPAAHADAGVPAR